MECLRVEAVASAAVAQTPGIGCGGIDKTRELGVGVGSQESAVVEHGDVCKRERKSKLIVVLDND